MGRGIQHFGITKADKAVLSKFDTDWKWGGQLSKRAALLARAGYLVRDGFKFKITAKGAAALSGKDAHMNATGTSEGVKKAWDTRGRSQKDYLNTEKCIGPNCDESKEIQLPSPTKGNPAYQPHLDHLEFQMTSAQGGQQIHFDKDAMRAVLRRALDQLDEDDAKVEYMNTTKYGPEGGTDHYATISYHRKGDLVHIASGGEGSGRKKTMDNPAIRKAVRSDPRQSSLYGPKHTDELKEYYHNIKEKSLDDDPENKNLPHEVDMDQKKLFSSAPGTGWSYGQRHAVGFVPKRTTAGFPKTGGVGKGTSALRPNQSLPRLEADYGGEPMAGNMANSHIDPLVWFHPPSLSKRNSNESLRVPADDPREKNDKYLDVTKRDSPDTQEFRMKILKRSNGGPNVPARTTLIAPHTATYQPGMLDASARLVKRIPMKLRPVGSPGAKLSTNSDIKRSFTSYSRRGCI